MLALALAPSPSPSPSFSPASPASFSFACSSSDHSSPSSSSSKFVSTSPPPLPSPGGRASPGGISDDDGEQQRIANEICELKIAAAETTTDGEDDSAYATADERTPDPSGDERAATAHDTILHRLVELGLDEERAADFARTTTDELREQKLFALGVSIDEEILKSLAVDIFQAIVDFVLKCSRGFSFRPVLVQANIEPHGAI